METDGPRHAGRGRNHAGGWRQGMSESTTARKAGASRMHNVMRVIRKADVLLKRWAELCSQTVKGSKEAAWLLANGRGTKDFMMERKCPQRQASGSFIIGGWKAARALRHGVWPGSGDFHLLLPGPYLGSEAALKVLFHVSHGNFVLRPFWSTAARHDRSQI